MADKKKNRAVYASIGHDRDGYLLYITREAPLRYRIPDRIAGGLCALTGHRLENFWPWHTFITKVSFLEIDHQEEIHAERIDVNLARKISPAFVAWEEEESP